MCLWTVVGGSWLLICLSICWLIYDISRVGVAKMKERILKYNLALLSLG